MGSRLVQGNIPVHDGVSRSQPGYIPEPRRCQLGYVVPVGAFGDRFHQGDGHQERQMADGRYEAIVFIDVDEEGFGSNCLGQRRNRGDRLPDRRRGVGNYAVSLALKKVGGGVLRTRGLTARHWVAADKPYLLRQQFLGPLYYGFLGSCPRRSAHSPLATPDPVFPSGPASPRPAGPVSPRPPRQWRKPGLPSTRWKAPRFWAAARAPLS